MTTPNEETGSGQIPERRFLTRHRGNATANVLRETDLMRTGIEGKLKDVSTAGVGLLLKVPLDVGERITVTLTNEVQRFNKEVRGTVRHSTPFGSDVFHIGVELEAPLAPMDVDMLRKALPKDDPSKGAKSGD